MEPSVHRVDQALRAMRAIAAPPPSARIDAILRSLRPVARASPLRSLAATAAASVLVAAAHVASLGVRADVARVPTAWLAAVAMAWTAGFLGMLALAMTPQRGSMLPDPTRVRAARVVGPLAAIAFGATWAACASDPIATWTGQAQQGAICLFTGLEIAVAPFVGASLAMRRALPVDTRALGAGLGAAGGALGALALHFRCGAGGALHGGLAHGGTALVGALLGGAILPRVFSSRFARYDGGDAR